MEDFLPKLLSRLPEVLGGSAVVATLAAATLTILIRFFFDSMRSHPESIVVKTGPRVVDRREETRIDQAVRELTRQEGANRWNRWVSGALTANTQEATCF
jgi:hypothetical protein